MSSVACLECVWRINEPSLNALADADGELRFETMLAKEDKKQRDSLGKPLDCRANRFARDCSMD